MPLIPGVSRIGNYIFVKPLGSGAFASVWLARHVITNVQVAIKMISKSSIDTPEDVTRFTREISLLKQIKHPFIAELYEVLEDDESHHLILEFAEGGTLQDFLYQKGKLTEQQARHYFSQLISVLEYLHREKRIAHRDLKPDNLLIDRHHNIRVIDFGLSNQFASASAKLSTACGCPATAAPEMIQGQGYTTSAEIWSSGMVLYHLVAGCLPFQDGELQRLLHSIVHDEITYPSFISPALTDLLQKMLVKNPENRISVAKIKQHPWFSQSEYAALLNASLGKIGTEFDKDVVQDMAAMGIDCRELHHHLFTQDFSELTAMYRMLLKERLTDRMQDILRSLQRLTTDGNEPEQPAAKERLARLPGSGNLARTTPPMPFGRKSDTKTQSPQPGQVRIAARRFSRPTPLRKTDVTVAQPMSLESP
jgi:serine/threonine protein kinase